MRSCGVPRSARQLSRTASWRLSSGSDDMAALGVPLCHGTSPQPLSVAHAIDLCHSRVHASSLCWSEAFVALVLSPWPFDQTL